LLLILGIITPGLSIRNAGGCSDTLNPDTPLVTPGLGPVFAILLLEIMI